MRTLFFSIIFIFTVIGYSFGQDGNRQQYVQVPAEFDFLKYENQYEVNALTDFLFEKYGFEVLYEKQVPSNLGPCEVLKANVHSDSGLFRTRLYVTLENCRNEIVFTSQTGTSRKKHYEKAYNEALREAFESLEDFEVKPEVNHDLVPAPEDGQDKNSEIILDPVVTSEEMKEVAANPSSAEADNSSQPRLLKFFNGGRAYILKPTAAGFDLYREGEKEKFGTLLKSGGGENFLYSSKNISGNAFFDTSGNLVVEYLDPNSQQLISVKYTGKDQ